jgi:hypothetical protein
MLWLAAPGKSLLSRIIEFLIDYWGVNALIFLAVPDEPTSIEGVLQDRVAPN